MMAGKLRCERLMRLVMLGHNHQPTRSAVQTMHDPRTCDAADARETLNMMQQGIHQRSGGMPRGWMNHHARRLVDDHQVGVFKDDVEGKIFRNRAVWLRRRYHDRRHISLTDLVPTTRDGLTIERHGPLITQRRDA